MPVISVMSHPSVYPTITPLHEGSVPLCRKVVNQNKKRLVLLSSNSATHSLRTVRTTVKCRGQKEWMGLESAETGGIWSPCQAVCSEARLKGVWRATGRYVWGPRSWWGKDNACAGGRVIVEVSLLQTSWNRGGLCQIRGVWPGAVGLQPIGFNKDLSLLWQHLIW